VQIANIGAGEAPLKPRPGRDIRAGQDAPGARDDAARAVGEANSCVVEEAPLELLQQRCFAGNGRGRVGDQREHREGLDFTRALEEAALQQGAELDGAVGERLAGLGLQAGAGRPGEERGLQERGEKARHADGEGETGSNAAAGA
jgi:hypothetical protein